MSEWLLEFPAAVLGSFAFCMIVWELVLVLFEIDLEE